MAHLRAGRRGLRTSLSEVVVVSVITAPTWVPPGLENAAVVSGFVDDVSSPRTRLWNEVLEDANPAYFDLETARASRFSGIIAPPAMILSWATVPDWVPTGPVPGQAERVRYEDPAFPHTIGLGSVQIHARPLLLGERLAFHLFISPPTEPEETERGLGRRQLRSTYLVDESGSEISRIEIDALRTPLPSSSAVLEEIPLPEMPDFDGPPAGKALHATDGEVLPEIRLPITLRRCIKWVAASRDYFPAHHDADFARSRGAHDLYIGQHFYHGLFGRFVTDWTGPGGFLRRLEFTQWGRVFPGETSNVVGRVTSVRRDTDDERDVIVELEMASGCERGKVYDALATVVVKGS